MFHRFYYGWVIVGVTSMTLFAATSTAPPVFTLFITPMGQEMGWSRTLMSGAVSLGTLAMAPVLPLVGRWLDRYGARRVVAIGGLMLGVSLISLGWVRGVWGFYIAFGISRMLAQGVLRISSTTAVSNWFIRKRGRTQAILNVGRSVGATTLPLIAYFTMQTMGWRVSWMVIGIIVILIVVLPAALFLRRRPEDLGLRPDGLPPEVHPADAEPSALPSEAEPEWTLQEALRTPALWLITSAIAIRGVAAPGVTIHLMPYLLDQGIDAAVSALAVSVGAACIGIGGMIWGLLAERVRVGYLLASTMASSGVALIILLLTHSAPMAFAYVIVSGLALGGSFTLEVIIWADYFGRKSLGIIQGFTMPFIYIAMAIGPMAAGISYDLAGSYQIAFSAFLFSYFVAAAMMVIARPPRKALTSHSGSR
ncbi:MAG: MFS transporter [Dehalococcoidia bacterium]|jgi:MFS family permease|nr:MFS transporter [Dehalococcoidia bacterium]MDP7240613.1 MFS transporter [Dehalococcoidia bacterium]MDP7469247.1 MFS transporter [Dehalococcoidia bacterium]